MATLTENPRPPVAPDEDPTTTTTDAASRPLQRDELLDTLKARLIADYAPPFVRAVVAVIDLALLAFLCFVSAALLANAMGYQSTYNATTGVRTDYYLFSPAVIVALTLAYFPGCWAKWGRTPAMRLLGLRIRNADDLSPIDKTTAMVRFGALLLSIAPGLLGLLVAFVDPRRQAFHDRLTGTVVVAE